MALLRHGSARFGARCAETAGVSGSSSSSACNKLMTRLTHSSGDVHSAAAKVKDRLPGSKPDVEKKLEGYGAEAGAKVDKAVCILLPPSTCTAQECDCAAW